MQNQPIQEVVEALRNANNVMVTVKSNPSVDELTAAVGLTLILNRMNKHATTVFSGIIPSTIEFLQPEMAIETNTDSLRDFIIALDKSKADKLRYKIEDNVVRIFITPYKRSITRDDLEFSQGEFNVDVVVALGVVGKEEFDQAIVSHGRILHDATIIGVTKGQIISQIGTLNWQDPQASSVSEMITGIADLLGENVLDGQIATSLMTGMVAETDRFRNANTTPRVLALSSKLMSAGANQQLIATKLEEDRMVRVDEQSYTRQQSSDGMLEVDHDEENEIQNIFIDDSGNMQSSTPAVDEYQNSPLQNSNAGVDLPENQPQNEVVDSTAEPDITERGYIDNSANDGPVIEDPQLSSSLFKDKDENNDVEENKAKLDISQVPENTSNDQVMQHHKRIEPLPNPVDENSQAQPPQEIQSTVPPVNMPDTPGEPQIDDYIGSTRSIPAMDATPDLPPPPPSEESTADVSTVNDNLPPPPISSHRISSQKDDDGLPPPPAPSKSKMVKVTLPEKNKTEEKNDETDDSEDTVKAPPPEVINPTSAPSVPPPIMPPMMTDQPQFFEADGSRSNPFLNPAE